MSATAIAEPPAMPSANGVSPVDYVGSLSPEVKQEVLIALLRELIEINGGNGLIPFNLPNGESLGHYVPPAAAMAQYEAMLNEMPPAIREAMTRPLPDDFDPDDCLTDEELEVLNREIDESVSRRSQSS